LAARTFIPANQPFKAQGDRMEFEQRPDVTSGMGDDEQAVDADDRERRLQVWQELLEQREQAAEDRDEVADRREKVGDDREAQADLREQVADERESEADRRDHHANERDYSLRELVGLCYL
jgi:uncharacterized protein (DUF3084 family)